jgi:hypothetical protein
LIIIKWTLPFFTFNFFFRFWGRNFFFFRLLYFFLRLLFDFWTTLSNCRFLFLFSSWFFSLNYYFFRIWRASFPSVLLSCSCRLNFLRLWFWLWRRFNLSYFLRWPSSLLHLFLRRNWRTRGLLLDLFNSSLFLCFLVTFTRVYFFFLVRGDFGWTDDFFNDWFFLRSTSAPWGFWLRLGGIFRFIWWFYVLVILLMSFLSLFIEFVNHREHWW